jgi:hypothetical protein
MIYQELKRRFLTKYVIFSIMGILLLTVGLSEILIRQEKNLPEIIKEEAVYSGKITEDKLWIGLKKVRDEKSDEVKYQPLVNFIYNLVNIYPRVLYYENKIEDYPDSYAKNFYECWRKKSIVLIEKIPKKNQPKALNELNKVNTPFVKYPGCYFWSSGIDNLRVIYLIIIFMVTFFAAGMYADSVEDGSMEIMYPTPNGKKMMFIRMIPTIIYGFLLTMVATLATVLILNSVTGSQALKSSLQAVALFSIGNFTLGSGILLMFVSELLGVLASTTIMGWISYKTSKTSLASAIGISINIIYIIIGLLVNMPLESFRIILNAFPTASSQIINEVSGFNFDFGIWRPYEIIVSMIVIFIIFCILISHEICKDEI